jgi:sulfur-carrier protein
MGCTVRIASPLRSYTAGAATLAARGRTLAEVLAHLEQRCPGIRFRMVDEQNRIRPHMRLFVNTCEALELSASVRDGDTVHIICALSGG